MIKPRWCIPDLIDLEFFLDQDEGVELENLAARDREVYTRLTATAPDTELADSALLHGWLVARKQTVGGRDGETPLPGQIWQELFSLFFWGSLVSGLVSGGTLAFSFLSYSGTRPVNVSAYFGIFVALQVVLLGVLVLLFAYRRMLGRSLEGSFFYRMLRRFFYALIFRIGRRATSAASAETRLKWSGRLAGLSQLQQRYGRLFIRPFFLLAQLFGVCFNAGVLIATLLKVVGSDVAFGWQTTLQLSGATVHALVRWISLLWSWFLPVYCCPSLAQIEGSKLVLKDGIYDLATHDLTSWWPFLCLAVLCYALLPRFILLLAGFIRQRRELAELRFDHGRYRQLVHRMRTPLVVTSAPAEEQQEGTGKVGPEIVAAPVDRRPRAHATASMTALVPDELFDECPEDALRNQVRARLGYELAGILPFWSMERSEEEELALLQERMRVDGSGDILLLQEAWQPPIQELLSFLLRLRATVGGQPIIVLALIGKPAGGTILTPVKKRNLQIWQQKLAALGDPGLQLVELVQ